MTAKQQRFCDEYLITLKAREAALRAGYAPKSASHIASELLHNNSETMEYIQRGLDRLRDDLVASQEEVIRYLTSVVRGEITEQLTTTRGDVVETIPRVADRTKAAELLGKRYALWTEKSQIDVQASVVVVDDVPETDDAAE